MMAGYGKEVRMNGTRLDSLCARAMVALLSIVWAGCFLAEPESTGRGRKRIRATPTADRSSRAPHEDGGPFYVSERRTSPTPKTVPVREGASDCPT